MPGSRNLTRALEAPLPWLLAIVAAGLIAYSPLLVKQDLVNWDSPAYLSNSLVEEFPHNLGDFFTTPVVGNLHPLTMLSLATTYSLIGESPRGFALENVTLHLANSLCVFVFAYLLSDRKAVVAGITGFFFAVHPMHVESVAWIAEHKDVLYTFFFLLALIAHLSYLERGRTRDTVGTAIFFALSLLAKPAAVAFPLCMVVVDLYRGRRLDTRRLTYYAPFFAVSLAVGLATLRTQGVEEVIDVGLSHGWPQHVLFAAYGFVFYIVKAFLPIHLSAFHPYPDLSGGGVGGWRFALAPLVVVAAIGIAWASLRRQRVFFFGIAFYAASVVLVLNFVRVGHTLVAERYSYVPYIGIFFVIGCLTSSLLDAPTGWRGRARPVVVVGLALFALVCVVRTAQRVPVWTNSNALWSDVIARYPGRVAFAHESRAQFRVYEAELRRSAGDEPGARERIAAALADYDEAISIDARSVDAYIARGVLLRDERQDFAAALADFNSAVAIDPRRSRALVERARLRLRTGNSQGAEADLRQAEALSGLGNDAPPAATRP